jgi:aspartyl/asparaginyl-tRNA synthetase
VTCSRCLAGTLFRCTPYPPNLGLGERHCAVFKDGSCASGLQTVLSNSLNANFHGHVCAESVILVQMMSFWTRTDLHVTGPIVTVASPGAGQAKKLQVGSLKILGGCSPDISLRCSTLFAHARPWAYPIKRQALTLEYLRDHAQFLPRTDANAAMLRLRGSLVKSLHAFFEVYTPQRPSAYLIPPRTKSYAERGFLLRIHPHPHCQRL